MNETLTIKHIRNVNPNGIQYNCTVILEGNGEESGLDGQVIPDIILNTGGIGIKLLETHHVYLRNLSVTSVSSLATKPSTVGIVLTRDKNFQKGVYGSSQNNRLTNISVRMHNDSAANNNRGTIGIYNNTAESIVYTNIMCRANIPVVLCKKDIFDLCPENNYYESNKDHYFVGDNYLISYGGEDSTCLWLHGCENINGTMFLGCHDNPTSTSVGVRFTDNVICGTLNIDSEHNRLPFYITGGQITCLNIQANVVFAKCLFKLEKDDSSSICQFSGNIVQYNAAFDTASKTNLFAEIGTNCHFDTNVITKSSVMATYNIVNKGVVQTNVFTNSKPIVTNIENAIARNNVSFSSAGLEHNGTRRISYWGAPSLSDPFYAPYNKGDVSVNTSGTIGQPAFFIYDGSSFVPVGQIKVPIYANADISSATPAFVGQMIRDEQKNIYMGCDTVAGGFKRITNVEDGDSVH